MCYIKKIENFIYNLYNLYNIMTFKIISISADEEDIKYCDDNDISKSKLFQRAIKKHREDN